MREGRGSAESICLVPLYNASRSMPPCLTSPPPPLFSSHEPFSSFFIFLLVASLNYDDYLYHKVTIPSSWATTSISLEVKSTAFQLGTLIFHFLFLFIGFSTREGTRSWSTCLAQCTNYYCFVGVLSQLAFYRNCLG